jgi:folate-dependent phosphoribosylglycinamide formyltransferase PurN
MAVEPIIGNDGPRIVCVTAGGPYPWVIINALGDAFGQLRVLVEQPESKAAFLKRRARKIGWVQTAGQFATMIWTRFGKRFAARREAELIAEHGLKIAPDPKHAVINIASINDIPALQVIESYKPDLVFLAGCRMLSKATLAAIPCPVLNYHAGINPAYRGMNGAYFSRANDDEANFGTTIHLVDSGVDTGGVLKQVRIEVDGRDTILTYAMLMAAHSREVAVEVVRDVLAGTAKTFVPNMPSNQYFHPPIWSYLWTGLTKKIW